MKLFAFLALAASALAAVMIAGPAAAADTSVVDTVTGLLTSASAYLLYIPAALYAITWIAAATPSKVDNKYVGYLLDVVNFLAANVWKATNADAVADIQEAITAAKEKLESAEDDE